MSKVKLCCWYCLATDLKEEDIKERTGGINQDALCPKCGIDSVGYFLSFHELYRKHCKLFHFGSLFKPRDIGSLLEPRDIKGSLVVCPCGHPFCKDWDAQSEKVEKEQDEWE